jgi:hypothetical protein
VDENLKLKTKMHILENELTRKEKTIEEMILEGTNSVKNLISHPL